MRQILHIFQKDVHRHRPEIFISLSFLGLYIWITLRSSGRFETALFSGVGVSSWLLPWFSAESIPPLMVLFWIFLAVRLVQGEPLIGDRQWWVTKPYEWWELLAAKELFFAVFISLPLFFAQLYLLHHAGFPVLSNLGAVLYTQLTLAWLLFVTGTGLGCLTKNLWQAALAAVAALVVGAVVASLLQKIPNSSMSSSVGSVRDAATGLIASALFVGAIGWQYARRKKWNARCLLLIGAAVYFVPSALTPYAKLVEKKYPLVDSSVAPVQFTLVKIPQSKEPSKKLPYPMSYIPDVTFGVPLSVSGIAAGHLVRVDGTRVHIESSSAPKLDLDWQSNGAAEWPNQQSGLMFSLRGNDFNNLKSQPVGLQIELALTEFEETEARDITLGEDKFWDKNLGFCHLDERNPSVMTCIQALTAPRFTATFDPTTSQCEAPEDEKSFFDNRISHAGRFSSSSISLLSPVENYQIFFAAGDWWWDFGKYGLPLRKRIFLCPGAKVRLAVPQAKGQVRIKMQLDGVRLGDFLNGRFP